MDKRKHIALLVDTSTTWGSDVIRGVLRYARQQPQWVVHIEPRGKYEVVVPPSNWRGHGLIARITNSQLAEYLSGLGMVAVNVSWYPFHDPEARIAHCTTDVQLAGQMCAEHFLERGLRNVAYCGASHRPNYVDELEQSFGAAMKRAGLECAVFESRTKVASGWFSDRTWGAEYVVAGPAQTGRYLGVRLRSRSSDHRSLSQRVHACARGSVRPGRRP